MWTKILDFPNNVIIGNQAIDISGYENHGNTIDVLLTVSGGSPSTKAFRFNGQTSRVFIPVQPVWQDLYAIRVEAVVKINDLGHRHNIIEGALSFALFVRANGVVTATFLGLEDDNSGFSASNTLTASVLGGGSIDPFSTLTAQLPSSILPPGKKLAWIGVNSSGDFSPTGIGRSMQPDTWVKITFIHNGTSLWLYMDNQLVGVRHEIESAVLPVQSDGVHLGAWPPQNEYLLNGDLDSLKVWKFDPYHRYKKFFCRPMSPPQEACWRTLFGRIRQVLNDPDSRPSLIKILDCMEQAENNLIRAIQSQGTEAIELNRRFSRRYEQLWCDDQIDSEKMTVLAKQWGNWLLETVGDEFGEYLRQTLACQQKLGKLFCLSDVECLKYSDPKFGKFIELIEKCFPQAIDYCSQDDIVTNPYKSQ